MKKLVEHLRSDWYKYLLEMLVITIGIIGAFMLNGWKESSDNQSTEQSILREIRSNLAEDLLAIQDDLTHMDTIERAGHQLLYFIKNNDSPTIEFAKNVAKIRVTPHFDPNKSGYQLLLSKGVGIIQNDSLRKAITKLFESTYSYYYRYEEERIHFRLQYISPGLQAYFYADTSSIDDSQFIDYGSFSISLSDYSDLKRENKFSKLVSLIIFENEGVQLRARIVEQGILNLIEQISRELEQR
jgi:hypothetical protein